jgi:hypothetical protein
VFDPVGRFNYKLGVIGFEGLIMSPKWYLVVAAYKSPVVGNDLSTPH